MNMKTHKNCDSGEDESIFILCEDLKSNRSINDEILSEPESEDHKPTFRPIGNGKREKEGSNNRSLDLGEKREGNRKKSGYHSYGAIQKHLEKLEDRQRKLSNCMSPSNVPMASVGDGDSVSSTGTSTPSTIRRDDFGEQLMQLQLLVQEMKDGFVLAMQELGRIQDWDKNLSDRVETSERNNQRMINDLTQSVQQLKTDLTSTLVEVRKNSEMTASLSEQVQDIHNDRKQLLEEIKQHNTMQINERSKDKPCAADSDNNNSDSGKPHSNGDSSKSDWEGSRGKRVSPMMQPFMDSLPDRITGTMSPDTDSDSSATKAANHMLRMGNRTLREKYQKHQTQYAIGSSDSDDPHDILAQLPDGKQGGTLTKKDFEVVSSNDGQRLQIAQELLSTEKTYVSQLSFLKEKIVNPLIAEAQLSISDINLMFPPCLNKLLQKHTSLLGTLENRLLHWKYHGMLGDIFARLTSTDGDDFLQLYAKYVQNFSTSLSALSKQTNKSSKFQAFLKNQLSECSREESDITVYLMAPIQRIPNYVLCLKKLSKYTDSAHPDYFHVNHCLKQFSDFIANVNTILDSPLTSRKLSSASQSSTEVSISKRSKDSGIHSPDESSGGPADNIAALQRTWQECLKTSKPSKSTKSSSNKSEQKDNATNGSKTNHSEKISSRKSTPRPKSRPKLEKRSQSLMANPSATMAAPWGYDPQMMYNQQVSGSYGIPSQPMLANGPAYIYGHPQMMPHEGVYRGQHHSKSRQIGAANVQYMLGRGFDPRLYGQMQPANNINDRCKLQSDLDYLIFEENENEEESEGEEETPSYVPSTPSNSVPRTRIHSAEKSLSRRHRRDGHRSPISDAPSSPIFDEPLSSPDDVFINSPGRVDKPALQRSQTLRDFPVTSPPPQRDPLAKRKSITSLSSDAPAPVLLTDVWNSDTTPTEIDRYMERRRSVQDNRKAVIQSLKEMEDKMAKKNSISSSIKNIFRRRNLTEETIDEDCYEPSYEAVASTPSVYNTAPAHTTHKVTAVVHADTCKLKKSVSVSSRVEEIPETSYNNQEESPSGVQNKRRASAAAILSISYDENGDPCSAV